MTLWNVHHAVYAVYVGTYSISEGVDIGDINIITVEMTSTCLEDGVEFLRDNSVHA